LGQTRVCPTVRRRLDLTTRSTERRLPEGEALLARRRHPISLGASAASADAERAQREALRLLRHNASLAHTHTICTTYSIRPLRADEGQALCRFYTDGLSKESRFHFHYLMSAGNRDAADAQKCEEIAAAAGARELVCAGADDDELEACEDDGDDDAQGAGVRFDLVLLPQGDGAQARKAAGAIYAWAFFYGDEAGSMHEPMVGIAVADSLQGKGLGKKMMQALIAAARAAPMVKALHLNVLASNTRAVALYEGLGFRRLSAWHHDDHPFLTVNDTLVRMHLSLAPRDSDPGAA